MNARKYGIVCAILLSIVTVSQAADIGDFLNPSEGTTPVAITGGDTPLEFSVSCSSNSSTPSVIKATSLIAARNYDHGVNQANGRPRRKVCFQNQGATTVFIGSSTIVASDLFILGESTNTATSPVYCTTNSGAYYCAAKATAPAQTVVVLEETESTP